MSDLVARLRTEADSQEDGPMRYEFEDANAIMREAATAITAKDAEIAALRAALRKLAIEEVRMGSAWIGNLCKLCGKNSPTFDSEPRHAEGCLAKGDPEHDQQQAQHPKPSSK